MNTINPLPADPDGTLWETFTSRFGALDGYRSTSKQHVLWTVFRSGIQYAEADADRLRRAHEIVERERDQARRERDAAVRQGELKARVERGLAEAAEADRDEWESHAEARSPLDMTVRDLILEVVNGARNGL